MRQPYSIFSRGSYLSAWQFFIRCWRRNWHMYYAISYVDISILISPTPVPKDFLFKPSYVVNLACRLVPVCLLVLTDLARPGDQLDPVNLNSPEIIIVF